MDALNLLLGDFDRTKFFGEYWDKKSHYFAHHDNRFKGFIDMETVSEQVENCAVSKIMYRNEKKLICEKIITKREEFNNGKDPNVTLCETMLEKVGLRKEFLDSLQSQVRTLSDYYFNSYYSPTEHGYGLHIDPHPVFILQVEGKKSWDVGYETICPSPNQSIIMQPGRDEIKLPWAHLIRPTKDELYNVVLEQGDVLYIPAGCWHEARALDTHSLALTLAHARITPFDTFAYMLQRIGAQNPELLVRLPSMPTEEERGDAEDPLLAAFQEAMKHFEEVLKENLTPEKLRREYLMHAARKKNFPHLYQMEFKVPEKLEKDVNQEQAKRAQEKQSQ